MSLISMRKQLKKLLAVSILLLFYFGWVTTISAQYVTDDGWKEYGEKYWPTKPVRGGTYKYAHIKYVGLMNPNHWPINDFVALTYLYERLVYRDGQARASMPFLVESWRFLDPMSAITVLQQGVKYHDGSDFNAASVKYQIDWINDKKNGCWDRAYLKHLKSVEMVDAYTLKWNFKKPWIVFSGGVLGGIPGWPISAEALKKDVMLKEIKGLSGKARTVEKKVKKAEKKAAKASGKAAAKAKKKLDKEKKKLADLEKKLTDLKAKTAGAELTDVHPVGTGPFMLDHGSPGNYLKLKRNPNWWWAKKMGMPDMPYFDFVQVIVIPDPAIQLANLRAGKIHTMAMDKSMYQLVKNDPNLTVHINPGNHMSGLRFNLAKGPAKDIRVRKAISHAIDRKALIAGTQFGLARIASCVFPEDHWCHNPDLKPVAYNPELSKKLLAEAGYANGLTIHGFSGNASRVTNMMTAIQGMLSKVGVNWKVDALEPAAGLDRLRNLEFEMSGGGYAHIWDPDLISTNLYHPDGGFNYGRSKNEAAIKLIEAGKLEFDDKKRQQIYFELEKVLYDSYEDIWLYHEISVVAYAKKVQGWNNEMATKYREGYQLTHPLWFKDGN